MTIVGPGFEGPVDGTGAGEVKERTLVKIKKDIGRKDPLSNSTEAARTCVKKDV